MNDITSEVVIGILMWCALVIVVILLMAYPLYRKRP